MGRPIKNGLDYFPLDTSNDDKLELIEAKFGLEGYAIIVKLWCRIYRGDGYFSPWGEREQLLFSRDINVDINRVAEVLMYAIKIGIFDKALFTRGVLTSRGVQKRFIEASKRRHELSFYKDLLLVNVDIIPVNVGNKSRCLSFNDYSGTQIEIEIEIETEIENEIEIKKKVAKPRTKKPTAVVASAPTDPLYQAVWQSFLGKSKAFTNYPKEAQATKRIIEYAGRHSSGDKVAFTEAVVTKFWDLTQNGSSFWRGQPFTPSALSSSGIFDRVIAEMKIGGDPNWTDHLDDYIAAAEGVEF